MDFPTPTFFFLLPFYFVVLRAHRNEWKPMSEQKENWLFSLCCRHQQSTIVQQQIERVITGWAETCEWTLLIDTWVVSRIATPHGQPRPNEMGCFFCLTCHSSWLSVTSVVGLVQRAWHACRTVESCRNNHTKITCWDRFLFHLFLFRSTFFRVSEGTTRSPSLVRQSKVGVGKTILHMWPRVRDIGRMCGNNHHQIYKGITGSVSSLPPCSAADWARGKSSSNLRWDFSDLGSLLFKPRKEKGTTFSTKHSVHGNFETRITDMHLFLFYWMTKSDRDANFFSGVISGDIARCL